MDRSFLPFNPWQSQVVRLPSVCVPRSENLHLIVLKRKTKWPTPTSADSVVCRIRAQVVGLFILQVPKQSDLLLPTLSICSVILSSQSTVLRNGQTPLTENKQPRSCSGYPLKSGSVGVCLWCSVPVVWNLGCTCGGKRASFSLVQR